MDREQAARDLELIGRVLEQTRRRVDPQMFHMIVWGTIVLVWYPLLSWLEAAGRGRACLVVSLVAIGSGVLLSAFLGWRHGRHPRLAATNTLLAQRLGQLTAIFIVTGVVLSFAVPILSPGGGGRYVPHVWGLLYALMLMTLGVIYSREFFFCGLPSLLATLAALHWVDESGYLLGPAMGLGCIVAGTIAERRVARLRRESVEAADAADVDPLHAES
jgi:hypothetical protein